MRYVLGLLFLLSAVASASAANVTVNSTLKRGTLISASDLNADAVQASDRKQAISQFIGQEVKRTIYEGQKITPNLIGAPILVKRNTQISLIYRFGRLEISATGRALGEGGLGDIVTVLNSESRKRVQGIILADGRVQVK